jgi:hypothetical protein
VVEFGAIPIREPSSKSISTWPIEKKYTFINQFLCKRTLLVILTRILLEDPTDAGDINRFSNIIWVMLI